MPLVQTRGAASAQGFGEFAQATAVNYIEDVFSCFLYTGNGVGYPSGPTITNGIDLAGKGGMVWGKARSSAFSNWIYDTARGVGDALTTNGTDAEYVGGATAGVNSFNSNGFGFGDNVYNENSNGVTCVSWTFRKQPKFFDVVTYTGTGSLRTIAHNLGSVPGCIIIKNLSDTDGWLVYHRSIGATKTLSLNTTGAAVTNGNDYFNDTEPTSSVFTVNIGGKANQSGNNYVAYLFAHDAGGFGLTGTDNVISCGSYTTDASAVGSVTLGWEPQWVLLKASSGASDWLLVDNMRGFIAPTSGAGSKYLSPNTSAAESVASAITVNATGFVDDGQIVASGTVIYIAIRRGPMKVPTLGTSVFGLSARSGTGANATVTGGQTDDAVLVKNRGSAVASLFSSRLTGTGYLVTSSTAAEVAAGVTILQANPWDVMDGVKVGTTSTITNASANTFINYLFRRAPGFFDEVCYTGDGNLNTSGSVYNVTHNLTVLPEMVIIKERSANGPEGWLVASALNSAQWVNGTAFQLNRTDAAGAPVNFSSSSYGTVTTFRPAVVGGGYSYSGNNSGSTYVAYLFATCAGVSKVGSYTGTGTTKQIDCGFTAGARFVLIKRTDSTGDWYVWDSARGIVAGNDPYLLLNSTAAEVTSTDYVDTYSAGFEISSTAPAAINASAGTFIFLAIA